MNQNKFIHLLYVPTMACNMACKYCYLEDNTKDDSKNINPLDTLKYAIDKFKESSVIPFNISLHGGEVTTLSHDDFYNLIEYIDKYYNDNNKIITEAGFKVGRPHIKTNMYALDKHIDTIKKFNVSISGSLDLPLKLHDKYRVTKGNKSTLDKILSNIKLMEDIPNKKKVSSTIFKEHFDLEEIIKDIKYLHKNTCLDMNDFNFMIGFDYNSNGILHHITEEEQLILYNKMHEEFDGTDLDYGVNGPWFDEFGPGYCSNCDNCGEKFFLLEKNGDIYSCVRGQKNKDYYYGNIYQNEVSEILDTAYSKIFINHNKMPLNEECVNCGYLYLCKTGCPFVKNNYNENKSYTCKLQQKMYQDRGYQKDIYNDLFVHDYIKKMRMDTPNNLDIKEINNTGIPSLKEIIASDNKLKYIYDSNSYILKLDDVEYKLESQILKNTRDIIYITPVSKVEIYVKKNILDELSDYPDNNSLYIILLSGDQITYGDENRTKQRHIATSLIYKGTLVNKTSDKEEYYKYDITNFIKEFKKEYSEELPNNLFFTTSALRDYHYIKQKENAYYHINAINLPFQNIEFYYIDKELK